MIKLRFILIAVRHTDDVRLVGLNGLGAHHTILSGLTQPEVIIAGIVAKRTDVAMLLVSKGLNGKWQRDTLPTTAYAIAGGLLKLATVADAVGLELLWHIEVVIASTAISKFDILGHTIYDYVVKA